MRRVGKYHGPHIHCHIWGEIAAAVSVANAGLNLFQGKKASDDIKDQRKKEAKIEQRVTEEELRLMERERLRALASNTAMAAYGGSDVTRDGSLRQVQADIEREFDLTREYTEEVGASRAQVTRREGKLQGQSLINNSIANALNTATSIFQYYDRPPE